MIFNREYDVGQQPCQDIKRQLESNEHNVWENEHQCYQCGGLLSLCSNCARDHHKNGYETCKTKAMKFTKEELEFTKLDAQRIANTVIKYVSYLGGRDAEGIYTRKCVLEEIIRLLEELI